MTPEQRRDLAEFEKLSPLQQRQALRRRTIVDFWTSSLWLGRETGEPADDAVRRTLSALASRGIDVCEATIRSWEGSYRKDGFFGLVDQRKLPRGRLRQYGPFFVELERVYTGPGLHSMDLCHDLATREANVQGWPVPPVRDSKRYLKKYILPGLTAERGGKFEGDANRASNDI